MNSGLLRFLSALPDACMVSSFVNIGADKTVT